MSSEFVKNLDLFSQPFQFNMGKQSLRKRTIIGSFLSVLIVGVTIAYLSYLSILYFSNQIDPKFRSQTFVSNEVLEMPINDDMYGFEFISLKNSMSLNQIEEKQNQTFIVLVPLFVYNNNSYQYVQKLDIIQCKDPSLIDYKCLDTSKLEKKQIAIGNNENINQYIQINAYRCQDVDSLKTFIPENCASAEEIENYIINQSNVFKMKLYTSQYNITSKQMQSNYKHQNFIMSNVELLITQFKAIKQITYVKEGPLIQLESTYSSPISYTIFTETLNQQTVRSQTGLKYFFQVYISLDEQVEYINIQFPIFTEILSLCNSALAFLMLFGVFGRQLAQNLIRQDLFILILQNLYSGTYQKILLLNNYLFNNNNSNNDKISSNQNKSNQNKSYQTQKEETDLKEEENLSPIQIPYFLTKSGDQNLNQVFQLKITNLEKIIDPVLENSDQILTNNLDKNNYQLDLNNQQILTSSNTLNRQSTIDQKKIFRFEEFKKDESQKKIFEPKKKYRSPQKQQKNEVKKYLINQQNNHNEVKIQTNKNLQDQKLNVLKDKSLTKKVQDLIFKLKFCKKSEYLSSKGLDNDTKLQIDQQVNCSLDYLKVYKEIIFLKKVVMTLLTKDQYAALYFVGLSDSFSNKALSQSKGQKMSHFEEMFEVSISEQQLIDHFKHFTQRCQNQENLNEIDQRIFSSLI